MISTTYIIKFSIYFLSKFFRAILCFINPDYRLIRTSPPKLIRISQGLLCMNFYQTTRCHLSKTLTFMVTAVSRSDPIKSFRLPDSYLHVPTTTPFPAAIAYPLFKLYGKETAVITVYKYIHTITSKQMTALSCCLLFAASSP
jgi:hypothetical protein